MNLHPASRRLCSAGVALVLLITSACSKKNPTVADEADGEPDLLFAHLRTADVQQAPIVAEIVKALLPGADSEADVGIRPGSVESISFALPAQDDGPSKIILIVACREVIAQDVAKAKLNQGTTARADFTSVRNGHLLHFPDAKTLVIVHNELADRYLEGYAKDRKKWPFNSSIAKAGDHSAVLVVAPEKLPADAKKELPEEKIGKLADAKTVTVAVDIKDKQLNLEARGDFADAAAAESAKDSLVKLIAEAIRAFGGAKGGANATTFFGALALALNEAKVESTGPELKAVLSYQADLPVAALIADGVQKVRQASLRATSLNNLRQLIIGLYSSQDAYGFLPIGGIWKGGILLPKMDEKPVLSWRVALLPFMEQTDLYNQFNLSEPWDSEHNKKLISKMPKVFAAPAPKAPEGHTFYQMVVGPAALRPMMSTGAMFDGAGNTFAVVESAQPVIWTKPDDISIPGTTMPADLKRMFGGVYPDGFCAVFWDGNTRWIDLKANSDKEIWAWITPNGGDNGPLRK
jgi:hypothetical protein